MYFTISLVFLLVPSMYSTFLGVGYIKVVSFSSLPAVLISKLVYGIIDEISRKEG